ncbi:NAD-dependent succinate-semialdehyde dehydrogenase [Polaribacter tangerinus]|uniref:NAD-dependent succinate-semialdehyde dehydrogenase n=1 Tax=Polaribacter tangerinus TaxID=1920034 RepID=UPI000B4A8424|nr:NAD-dependent succinate-semialdehyde dehydrogenase [Polaribacter tangerinus]
MIIKNKDLLCSKAIIGDWCNAFDKSTFNIMNPATNESIGTLPNMGEHETIKAIEIANEAFQMWKNQTVDFRSNILRSWAELIRENKDDLAVIMTMEQGKTIKESIGEIVYSASFLDWYAEEAQRPIGRMMPAHQTDQKILITHEPLGVGATITPWNFPALMVMREVAPALAAGCTVVIKPSELTPLTPLALVKLAIDAGLPLGVLSVITGDKKNTPKIGDVLTSHLKINKISFTGSTATGIMLAKKAMESVKKMSLELGGNAPFIVFDDADIDAALTGLISSKYRNSGQACVATNRVFIQKGIYNDFIVKFIKKVELLKVGNGLDADVDMGPLISIEASENMENYIKDSLLKGGELLTGGKRHKLGKSFFEPTVIANASDEMMPCQCEIFGPLTMIQKFDSEEEVIKLANNSIHGLAAYFYSNDRKRSWRVSEALKAGIIGENTVSFSTPRAPFGGYKQSGIGRNGGSEGLVEWQEVKYRCIGDLN